MTQNSNLLTEQRFSKLTENLVAVENAVSSLDENLHEGFNESTRSISRIQKSMAEISKNTDQISKTLSKGGDMYNQFKLLNVILRKTLEKLPAVKPAGTS